MLKWINVDIDWEFSTIAKKVKKKKKKKKKNLRNHSLFLFYLMK